MSKNVPIVLGARVSKTTVIFKCPPMYGAQCRDRCDPLGNILVPGQQLIFRGEAPMMVNIDSWLNGKYYC